MSAGEAIAGTWQRASAGMVRKVVRFVLIAPMAVASFVRDRCIQ